MAVNLVKPVPICFSGNNPGVFFLLILENGFRKKASQKHDIFNLPVFQKHLLEAEQFIPDILLHQNLIMTGLTGKARKLLTDPDTSHPVISLMPDQNGVEDLGGTLRLGAYPCVLAEDSLAYRLYGTGEIQERHRHRYEVNNEYREALLQNGMKLSGISPDGRIVEMIELPDHPYFLATQAHPEFKSRPNRPHPLFAGLIRAAVEYHEKEK